MNLFKNIILLLCFTVLTNCMEDPNPGKRKREDLEKFTDQPDLKEQRVDLEEGQSSSEASKNNFDSLPPELLSYIIRCGIDSILNENANPIRALRACNNFLLKFRSLSKYHNQIVNNENEWLLKYCSKKIVDKIEIVLSNQILDSVYNIIFSKIIPKINTIHELPSSEFSEELISKLIDDLNSELDQISKQHSLEPQVKAICKVKAIFNCCNVQLSSYIQQELMNKTISFCISSTLNNILIKFSKDKTRANKTIIKILLSTKKIDRYINFHETLHPLHVASEIGNKELVELLLQNGADVNAQDNEGLTALMLASIKGHTETVNLLLQNGANVNAQNNNGRTALMDASYCEHTETVAVLLRNGANVNARENGVHTALMLASAKGHTEIVNLLLQHGADIYAQDNEGLTAFMLASSLGYTKIVELLLQNNADVNAQNNNGLTALMVASYCEHTETVDVLLQNGANVNARENGGHTALMVASLEGHTEIVELLLQNGVDVNTKNNKGETALMAATRKGHTEVVNLLLQMGANINIQDNDGKTALTDAEEKGHTEIAAILRAKIAESLTN